MKMFIVIEGLDGSGKTTAAKALAETLSRKFPGKVKFTFEPNDDCCGGQFIRQVLRKEVKVSPRTLALAYAANRSDHCDRVVRPWLESGGIVVCDRFYLSSLVYNSAPDFPFESVMRLNEMAIRPDLFFFVNTSDDVVRQRLKNRNLPPELFDEKVAEMKRNYSKAIDFLRATRGERIIEIDGDGSVAETVEQMLNIVESEIQK